MIAVSTTPTVGRRKRTSARKAKLRTCAGCRQEAEQPDLVRLVLGPDESVVVDLAAGGVGRGVWIHPAVACISKAAPRGIARSLRASVKTTPTDLTVKLREAADRRILGLLSSARRAQHVALGSEAVRRCLTDELAKVIIVATDARASATTPWVAESVAAGNTIAWGNKKILGAALGREEVGVLAILDDGLARALRRAAQICGVPMPDGVAEVNRE